MAINIGNINHRVSNLLQKNSLEAREVKGW